MDFMEVVSTGILALACVIFAYAALQNQLDRRN